MQVKIKRLSKNAMLPQRGSKSAAGYDLYSLTDIVIPPHMTSMIRTGISVEIPEGYFGAIFARSGLATIGGVRPANCVGVIDSDYRGEICVALHNDTDNLPFSVSKGLRIAQLVILPYLDVSFVETDKLSETERGSSGLGSTGK